MLEREDELQEFWKTNMTVSRQLGGRKKITDFINRLLQKFDLVLLVMNGSGPAKNLTENFLNSEALQKAAKKILILSDQNIPYTNTHHHINTHYQYCQLSTEELDAIRNIYFMYDFSDHFRVLSDSGQYGGLLDYVETGILTLEDVFQTVLVP